MQGMQVNLLIFRKKRVSSISQESDTTTWLGDDVLGVEVIKYNINGYSVDVKREENSRGNFCFFLVLFLVLVNV